MNNSKFIQPVNRTKREAKKSYNKISNWYDVFSLFEKKYREKGIKELAIKEKQKTLEIGFGTGKSLVKMIKQSNCKSTFFGIDISDKMCLKTHKLLRKKNYANISFLTCGDATCLPYKDSCFDSVLLSFTLELFSKDDIMNVLLEIHRVLKRNGRICVIALSRRKVGFMVKLYEWSHNKWPSIIDCRPIYTEEYLINSNFEIDSYIKKTMWGLPVDIIVGIK